MERKARHKLSAELIPPLAEYKNTAGPTHI